MKLSISNNGTITLMWVLVYAFDKIEIDAQRLISDVVTGHYV